MDLDAFVQKQVHIIGSTHANYPSTCRTSFAILVRRLLRDRPSPSRGSSLFVPTPPSTPQTRSAYDRSTSSFFCRSRLRVNKSTLLCDADAWMLLLIALLGYACWGSADAASGSAKQVVEIGSTKG